MAPLGANMIRQDDIRVQLPIDIVVENTRYLLSLEV